MQKLKTLPHRLVNALVKLLQKTKQLRNRVAKTRLRTFGSGKVYHNNRYYNVIFHMVYEAPTRSYKLCDIEREATLRFNLSKCLILDVANIDADTILLSPRQAESSLLRGAQFPSQDKLQYLIPAEV